MGSEINTTVFTPQDHVDFKRRLEDNLAVLEALLQRPGFAEGHGSLGAELEMYIIDDFGKPLYANTELQQVANDPQLTLELNRYNLEYNLTPYAMSDRPFTATENEILAKLTHLRSVAADFGGRIVPIGILPTLTQSDFGPHCVTDRKRYHALVSQLIKRRGSEFKIDIQGDEPLQLQMEDITLEGANTSFQVHYRVAPEKYADTYNAIQMATPLALAIGANSPTLFGRSLWHETRIPLFKQSIDTRQLDRYSWKEPARVNFGLGWARRDAMELFNEVVRLYPPLLPVTSERSAADQLAAGEVPELAELKMHQSTVWLWNRPIYDDVGDGQLRIEMRALPAGPTAIDMVANAAFLIGLAEGLRPMINNLLPALPFQMAEYNFYRAAQRGLDAPLVWPELKQSGCRERSASAIIDTMLPVADEGLASIGIDSQERGRYLGVIANRLERQRTGATWQQDMLSRLGQEMPREPALHRMLEEFLIHSTDNRPVSEWPL